MQPVGLLLPQPVDTDTDTFSTRTRTRTRARTRARTRTHTQTHTRTRTRTRVHKHTRTRMHAHARTRTHKHTHTCTNVEHTNRTKHSGWHTSKHICNHFMVITHSRLQHTATHCNKLQHTATRDTSAIISWWLHTQDCNTLQHTATHCNKLQHTATRDKSAIVSWWLYTHDSSTLQHTASHCNTRHICNYFILITHYSQTCDIIESEWYLSYTHTAHHKTLYHIKVCHLRLKMCSCVIIEQNNIFLHSHRTLQHSVTRTGWRRLIGCLKSQVIFRKRATNSRALLRKMTYEDKASYDSTPPCTRVSS